MIGRFGRVALVPLRAAIAFVTLLFLIAAPTLAEARTYPTDPGPMPEGDPTADDQPSPTPKQNQNLSKQITGERSITGRDAQVVRERPARIAWQAYLRLIARITLR